MTPFDLLFLLLVLVSLATLGTALVRAIVGRRGPAARLLQRWAIGAGGYLVLVYGSALLSPRRVLALGSDLCSDDWCIAVARVRETAVTGSHAYDVVFRLRSRARRVSQRERGVLVYVHGSDGHRYDGEASVADAPFDVRLAPQEELLTSRRFVLPTFVSATEVVLTRRGLQFPGCLIIGEAAGVIRPPVVRL
jgi:hypothetical protein